LTRLGLPADAIERPPRTGPTLRHLSALKNGASNRSACAWEMRECPAAPATANAAVSAATLGKE
jgi:hypothetical protein